MKNKIFIAATVGFCIIMISGCSKKTTAGKSAKKTADLVYVNWEEGVDYTHLAAAVLEEKLGYTVNLTAADVAPAYVSIAQGDKDAFMEAWLPTTHKSYLEKYGDRITELGTLYTDTALGLVVPSYMYNAGVQSISDLLKPDVQKKLNSKITGIDAGAGVMLTTENDAMPAYGLDKAGYKLVASSGPAMMASLKQAIANKEYIVVTGWQPHSMFGYFDLKFLKQDKQKIWDSENIYIYGRKNIRNDKPELAQFLSTMKLTNDELSSLMVALKESDKDTLAAAYDWMHDHEEVVSAWLPKQ
jgi:glycine betaine/proline transport system substrate-binding protein